MITSELHEDVDGSRRHHQVFISYTSREEELEELRPFMSDLLSALDGRGDRGTVQEFIWLDLHRITLNGYCPVMHNTLASGVRASLAFVSPGYWTSEWCQFELGVAIGTGIEICFILGKDTNHPMNMFRTYTIDARRLVETQREERRHFGGYREQIYRADLSRIADEIQNVFEIFGARAERSSKPNV